VRHWPSDFPDIARIPFSRDEARQAGLGLSALRRLQTVGLVIQPVRGVYLNAALADNLDLRARCVARILPPGAAIGRLTAAWIRGVDARSPTELAQPMPIECIVPVGSQPTRRAGIRCFQAPLDGDLVEEHGLMLTSAVRTAVDLMRWLPPHMGLASADALAGAGLVTSDELVAAVERWPGHPGIAVARRLAPLVEPGAESFPESWLRLRLVEAGFPRPEVQIEILDGDGHVVYRLDLGWLKRLVAVEYDGEKVHDNPRAREHDAWRRTAIERRFGWSAVIGVAKGEVLGRSMALEFAVGELLGMEPTNRRRLW
jgi:hypothetical protein